MELIQKELHTNKNIKTLKHELFTSEIEVYSQYNKFPYLLISHIIIIICLITLVILSYLYINIINHCI